MAKAHKNRKDQQQQDLEIKERLPFKYRITAERLACGWKKHLDEKNERSEHG